MTSKKIGINGQFLRHPFTGIGQYTIQLLKEFSKMKTGGELSAAGIEFLVVLPDESCVETMNQEQITLPFHVLPEISWLPRSIQKHAWEQIQLPHFFQQEAFEKTGADMVWLPYPCPPWFTKPTYNTIVTVHDTIPWTMSEYRTGALSSLAHMMSRRAIHRLSMRSNNHIITVSKTSADEIADVCDVPRDWIHVIYNGVSEIFKTPADPKLVQEILQQYHLTRGEYFLYVGGYDSRKRVARLINSYREYAATIADSSTLPPLVLVGGKALDSALYQDFDAAAYAATHTASSLTKSQKPDIITLVRTGFLEESYLNALYEGCRAFLHFSQQEGFNIPLAQALVKHLPCAISDIPVHREIAGPSALYVNPDDTAATVSLWRTLTTSPSIPFQENLDYLDQFSWKTSAQEHMNLFTYDDTIPSRDCDQRGINSVSCDELDPITKLSPEEHA